MGQVDVAIAIIHRAGKVLVSQRRRDDTFADLWEFPGGKVEAGETPEQCLAREAREELGITVQIIHPFATIEYAYPHLTVRLFPFRCSLGSGEPVALASQRLEWVGAQELSTFAFPAANAGLLQKIISILGGEGFDSLR